METGLGPFPQMHGHHRLSDPISDRGHTEQPDPAAVRLGDLDTFDRGRKVGPRTHPIPDLVEVVPQIGLELAHGLLVHSRRPLAGRQPRDASHTACLGMTNGLTCGCGMSPLFLPERPPRLIERTVLMSRPLGSTPTPDSRSFPATTGRSASERRIGTQRLRSLPRHAPSRSRGTNGPVNGCRYRRSPSHVPCTSRRPSSRHLRAGHHLANTRAPARLIPGAGQGPPVSMPSAFYTLQQRHPPKPQDPNGLLDRLLGPHLTWSHHAFSLSLTTTVFSQRSAGWFDARPRRPTPEGQPSPISCTAPLPDDLPTSILLPRS
jgi:hypothetical protein